ncbi:MAG: GNAT family N-acetyltransferase [Roseiarcus sp.]
MPRRPGPRPVCGKRRGQAWFDVLPPRTAKLVAVSGDVPVGIGILAPDGGSRAHTGSLFLAVHDRFHRRGIGGALLRTLIASAERFYRLERLGLVVVCKNDVAIKMYQKYGFQIEGRQVGALHYGGRFHDTYGMALVAHGLAVAAS